MTLLVLDKTDPTNLRTVFTLLGTPFKGTRFFWLSAPSQIMIGIFIAFVVAPIPDIAARLVAGMVYGCIIILAMFIHGFGHIISSRIIGAPVTYIQISATVNTVFYDDTGDLPGRIHIGRAVGGPLASLITAILAVFLYRFSGNNHFLAFAAFINLLMFLVTISPIPTLDGAVILREWRRRQS